MKRRIKGFVDTEEFLLPCRYTKDDAEVAFVEACAADAEAADLARAAYMGTQAGAYVIVAHIYQAQCLAGAWSADQFLLSGRGCYDEGGFEASHRRGLCSE